MAAPRIRTYRTESPSLDQSEQADEIPSSGETISWAALFGNSRLVEVEIGCGRGTFMLAAAGKAPERNFFGLECSVRLAEAARATLAGAGLTNARVLCCDARCVVSRLIPPASVTAYHIYFPDPWWKRRHHARRLYSGGFARAAARTLAPGGQIHVATDVPNLLAAVTERFTQAALIPAAVPPRDLPTTFARRCTQSGRPLLRATFAHP
jgi:tRNA (guanine-N7-)-methyltransferase